MNSETLSIISNTYGLNSGTADNAFNPWSLLINIIFSIIGLYAFNLGRKEKNWRWLILGVALMVYSYFIKDILLSIIIGVALTVAIIFWKE